MMFVLGYIGPGLGLGTIGVILAGIGGFFVLILGFIYYPIKKIIWKIKNKKNKTS